MKSSALSAGVRRLRGLMALQGCHDKSDEQLLHAFTAQQDDSAFAALVHRYGPLVLSVCRRVLGHQQDAEDAFQATFLVLTRNAATMRNKTALASFLHGTAYRLAMTAKRSAARRRKHESRAAAPPSTDPSEELSWREVRTLLDEEIVHLPEMYRSVLVLCCLENVSREEAARRLGLKPGTLSSRLAEARKRLQRRLARRGVELTALLAAAALAAKPAAALSPVLMANTLKAALAAALGEGVAGVLSAEVVVLGQGSASGALLSKAKMALAVLLTACALAGVGAWTCRTPERPQGADPFAETPKSSAGSKTRRHEDAVRTDAFTVYALDPSRPRTVYFRHAAKKLVGSITLRGDETETPLVKIQPGAAVVGRVLDAAGKPLAGMEISLQFSEAEPDELIRHELLGGRWGKITTTDTDGRFRLEGLFPGLEFEVYAGHAGHRSTAVGFGPVTLKAGEVRDLGDRREDKPR